MIETTTIESFEELWVGEENIILLKNKNQRRNIGNHQHLVLKHSFKKSHLFDGELLRYAITGRD